ncbi:MAG: type II secretion system protein [Lachnospiraceae bacterium]|nr:type II secretion system protein [Lachnospiraceae bacterium]
MNVSTRKKGFTLLEVLVCLGVIGILFLPLLTFFSGSMKLNVESKEKQRATNVAQEVMEEIKSCNNISTINSSSNWTRKKSDFTNNCTDEIIDSTTGNFKNKKYYYVSKNGYESDGKNYKVRVTVDCSKYDSDIFSKVPDLSAVGGGNVVMATEADETENVLNIYQRKNQQATHSSPLSIGELAKHLQKKIIVNVTDFVEEDGNNIVPEGMVRVQVYNEYTMTSVDGCENLTINSDKIFNDLVKYNEFRELYLFYSYDVYMENSDINHSQSILHEIDLNVDYVLHNDWKAKFDFNVVCRRLYAFDDNGGTTEDKSKLKKEVIISKKFNYISLPLTDTTIPVKSNINYSIKCGEESQPGQPLSSMEDFISDQMTQRFADVTVEVFGSRKKEANVVLKSTVMLSLEDRSVS